MNERYAQASGSILLARIAVLDIGSHAFVRMDDYSAELVPAIEYWRYRP